MPVFGGCAAPSNEGDVINITNTTGVQLRNMKNAWLVPILLEKALAEDRSMSGIFMMSGDSMIMVNKYGRRVANEKQPYNELTRAFAEWDGDRAEYANLVLIMIWDQRAQEKCAMPFFGSPIVPSGLDDSHVIKGDTLVELTLKITQRLRRYQSSTGVILAEDFLPNLERSISRFNSLAMAGEDVDFRRGNRQIELFMGGPPKEPGQLNPTMWPIADRGPYRAALIVAGTLDTKGGPKTDPDGRILNDTDQPIGGLYGVGNCVASPSNAAYWGGGSTLGPILTYAYRTANAIADFEPVGLA